MGSIQLILDPKTNTPDAAIVGNIINSAQGVAGSFSKKEACVNITNLPQETKLDLQKQFLLKLITEKRFDSKKEGEIGYGDLVEEVVKKIKNAKTSEEISKLNSSGHCFHGKVWDEMIAIEDDPFSNLSGTELMNFCKKINNEIEEILNKN